MASISSNPSGSAVALATRPTEGRDPFKSGQALHRAMDSAMSSPTTAEALAGSATTAERLLATPSFVSYPGDMNRPYAQP